MGNLLRQIFGLDEEYNKKILEWIDEQRKESIKKGAVIGFREEVNHDKK